MTRAPGRLLRRLAPLVVVMVGAGAAPAVADDSGAADALAEDSTTTESSSAVGSARDGLSGDTAQASGAVVNAVSADGDVLVSGRGYGHGRGLGQYGSLGYAVDYGWSSAAILDHYYGGTTAGSVGNPSIGVELVSLRDAPLVATGASLQLDGTPLGSAAVQLVRNGSTTRVFTGAGCGGPWTEQPSRGDTTLRAAGAVEVCGFGTNRGYRGELVVVARSGGSAVVNRLPVEEYLRGVVPRESPASWADAGGGRGAQALQAQSVAARSYSLSSQWTSYATTCDTTSCQVYGGTYLRSQSTGAVTSLEDRRSDAAIAATAGLVRRTAGGAVARTEFSSSTGGWTAGGAFPAVQDLGDAVAANPNRSWSVVMSRATISSRLGIGEVRGLAVTRRNGLGADGGRVLEVTARTAGGDVILSGSTVRSRLGLKSDWFSLSPFLDPAQFRPVVTAMWTDLLGRPPSQGDLTERTAQLAGGRTPYSVAMEVSGSRERAQRVVVATYESALGRTPSQGEISGWLDEFQRYGSIPAMQAAILGSEEAWNVSGRDPGGWVDRMYRVTLGRSAGQPERDYWTARVSTAGRYQVAFGIAGSYEAATVRLRDYYRLLLARDPDPGSSVWISSLLLAGNGDVFVPAAVAGSVEYSARAASRYP